jgi:hypothetical protein
MISVYRVNKSEFRVVAGPHVPAANHKKLQPTIYTSAQAAYATETDPAIRRAILMIDPAASAVTPDKMHHVVKSSKVCADCGAKLPGPYGTVGVSLARTRPDTLLCSDCGTAEALQHFKFNRE